MLGRVEADVRAGAALRKAARIARMVEGIRGACSLGDSILKIFSSLDRARTKRDGTRLKLRSTTQSQ